MTDYTLEPVEGNPFEDSSGYTLEEVQGNPFAEQATEDMPWYKKAGKALAFGAEQALLGADNTTNKAREALGLAKRRSMAAALANKLHQDDYAPASTGLMDPNKSIGERLSYAPRAMIEGLPGAIADAGTLALPGGLPAKAAAMAATHGYRVAGDKLDQAQAADGTTGQAPTAGEVARAAASTALDTGLSMYGVGSAIGAPVKTVGMQGVKDVAKEVGKAALAGAVDAGGQTAADSALLAGQAPNIEDVVTTGLMGAGAGGGFRLARGLPETGEAIRFRQFSDTDPALLTAAADEIVRQRARVKAGIDGENVGGRLIDEAVDAVRGRRDNAARGNQTKGTDFVQDEINYMANQGNGPDLVNTYTELMGDLKRGQPVNPKQFDALKQGLGQSSFPADYWFKEVGTQDVLNRLGLMGNRDGEAIRGGIHGTDLMQKFKPFSSKSPLKSWADAALLTSPLTSHATAHFFPLFGKVSPETAAMIMGGQAAAWGGLRGFDRLTGYSDPVGRFTKKFASPPSAPAQAIQQAVTQQATPPAGPAPAGPQTPPQPPVAPVPRSMPPMGDVVPPQAQAIMALQKMAQAAGQSIDPAREAAILAQTNAPRGATVDLGNRQIEVMPDQAATKTYRGIQGVTPSEMQALEGIYRTAQDQGAPVDLPSELNAIRAKVKNTPDNLLENFSDPNQPLMQKAMQLEGSVEAVEPPPQWKARKEAAFARREERKRARSEKAQSSAESQSSEGPNKNDLKTEVWGRTVEGRSEDITHSKKQRDIGINRRAGQRLAAIERMKRIAPGMDKQFEDLFTYWLSPGVHQKEAVHALEELANHPDLTPSQTARLLDAFMDDPNLSDPQHWRGKKK